MSSKQVPVKPVQIELIGYSDSNLFTADDNYGIKIGVPLRKNKKEYVSGVHLLLLYIFMLVIYICIQVDIL